MPREAPKNNRYQVTQVREKTEVAESDAVDLEMKRVSCLLEYLGFRHVRFFQCSLKVVSMFAAMLVIALA